MSEKMKHGYKTIFGTIVPNNLVNLYNNFTNEIDKTSYPASIELLKDKRHHILNYFCNPYHPLFIGSGEYLK